MRSDEIAAGEPDMLTPEDRARLRDIDPETGLPRCMQEGEKEVDPIEAMGEEFLSHLPPSERTPENAKKWGRRVGFLAGMMSSEAAFAAARWWFKNE